VRRPRNAGEILEERLEEVLKMLKKVGYELEDIGFFDASSPQLSPNTASRSKRRK